MGKIVKNFLSGFAKALELYPDTSNGLSRDWENVGNDFKNAFSCFEKMKDKED